MLVYVFTEKPSPPVGPVRFQNVNADSLTMDWLPSKNDGGTNITAYLVEMAEKGGKWRELATNEGHVTKLKVKELKAGKEYVFRIVAQNKVGTSDALESEPVTPCRPPGKSCFPLRFIVLCIEFLVGYVVLSLS